MVSSYCYGQGSLKGKIKQKDGAPAVAVTVSLAKTNATTATNESGEFCFQQLPEGNYTLKVSSINYAPLNTAVKITNGNTTVVNLELNIADNLLEELEISKKIVKKSTALTRTSTPLKDLPQSIQVVSERQIKDQQLLYVEESLKNVAGVNFSSPYGTFNYRGFETGLQDIMFNGMKGSPYPEGVSPMLSNVERIEVIHGPTAILYGQGALGGNINLVTKQPKKYTSFNVSAAVGNLNLYRTMADVSGSLNKAKSLYFVSSVGYQDGGVYLDNYKKRNLQLYGALRWDISPKTFVQVNGTYLNDKQTRNYQPTLPIVKNDLFAVPYRFNFSSSDAYYKGNSYQVQAEAQHQFNTNWSLHLLANVAESSSKRNEYGSLGYYNPKTTMLSRSYTKKEINSPSISINPYLNGKFNTLGIKNSFSFGINADFKRTNYPNGFFQYSANPIFLNNPEDRPFTIEGQTLFYLSTQETFTYNIFGAYIQDQIEITPKLKGLVGLRYANYYARYHVPSITYDGVEFNEYNENPEVTSAFIPRIGLVYQPWKNTSLYFDYNQGFTPQYNNAKLYGGPFDPETSNQYEFGYKGSFLDNSLLAGVSIYRIDKTNVLTNALDPSNPNLLRAIGQVRSQGVELSLTGKVTNSLFLTVNYSNNSTKVRKSNKPVEIGQTFSNSPKHMASIWASYQFEKGSLKGLQIGMGPRYTGNRFINIKRLNTDVLVLPRYTIADAMLGYQRNRYGFQFNINNIFDKRYAQSGVNTIYAPGMPRNFMFTATYSFKKS
ncbi:hypothetical protein AQF98_05030 [Pedobacter sp. Hv1]|nr:hypothetical protein AQF98_05030 [Pedobacter sp. Hv1]